ncbi:hypothetical protein GCM10010411_88750 [Actinomadura fulvescens]|uniref:Uncharacterized protein n=2 Tax=Actinomadura fulvescens TaxID=46160 RepID=A0ABP6D9T2_9ACTN
MIAGFAVAGVMGSPGLAFAGGDGHDGPYSVIGGTGSNEGSSNATGHSNNCGNGYFSMVSPTDCKNHHSAGHEAEGGAEFIGGLFSNIGSSSASGHSNNCGNAYVAFNSPTSCTNSHD